MSRATAMSMLTLFCLLSTLAAGMMEIQRESKAYTMEAYIQKFGHPEENGMGHRIVMLNGRQCVLVESDEMTVRIDGIVDGAPAAAADRLRVCTADRAPAAAADHPVDWASAAAANPPGHEGGRHEGGGHEGGGHEGREHRGGGHEGGRHESGGHEGSGREGGNAQDLQQCTGQDNNAQPKAKPPQAEPPKAEPPKAKRPKAEPPKAEPPKTERE